MFKTYWFSFCAGMT